MLGKRLAKKAKKANQRSELFGKARKRWEKKKGKWERMNLSGIMATYKQRQKEMM